MYCNVISVVYRNVVVVVVVVVVSVVKCSVV